MKQFILFLTLTIFSLPFGYSQDKTTQNTPTSSLLWEISGKHLENPSYIFGTMHLMPKKYFYFPEILKKKLESADVLVMEIAGLSEKAKAMKYMRLDTGIVWNYFTQPQLDSLFDYAQRNLGINKDKMRLVFSKMKPFVLLQLFTKKEFGKHPESYELNFEKIAKADSMKVLGLETIKEQMGFIDKLDAKKQVKMIMNSVRDENKPKDSTSDQLIQIYLKQNIDDIRKFISKSDLDSPTFETTLLDNRNKSWIKPIQKIIKKNKAFIAVGAAHLGGPNGVVELLRKKGYTLTPIKL